LDAEEIEARHLLVVVALRTPPAREPRTVLTDQSRHALADALELGRRRRTTPVIGAQVRYKNLVKIQAVPQVIFQFGVTPGLEQEAINTPRPYARFPRCAGMNKGLVDVHIHDVIATTIASQSILKEYLYPQLVP